MYSHYVNYQYLRNFAWGPVQNMMQGLTLRCIAFTLTLVTTQSNARIDLDSILAFLRIVFVCSCHEKLQKFEYFHVSQAQHNATQGPCIILRTELETKLWQWKIWQITVCSNPACNCYTRHCIYSTSLILRVAMFRVTQKMMSIEGCVSPASDSSRRCGSTATQDSSWQEQDGWRYVCMCVCFLYSCICS